MTENTLVELHSSACSCRGYGWHAHPGDDAIPAGACCALRKTGDEEPLFVDVERWVAFGLPRTIEAYRDAEDRYERGLLHPWSSAP